MGRKYLILFLVLCGAVDALGQENLDTLWTRRIGGTGNDVFYAMARGNDGNVLVCMYHSGDDYLQEGRYVLHYEDDGGLNLVSQLDSMVEFNSVSEIRETETDEIEIRSTKYIYLFGTDGSVLSIDSLPTDRSYDYPTIWGWRRTEASGRFHGDTTWATGDGHEEGYIEWIGWTFDGQWLATYDSGQDIVDEICFPCNAALIDSERYLSWETRRVGNDALFDIAIKPTRYWGTEFSQTFHLPPEFRSAEAGRRFVSILKDDGSHWILSRKRAEVTATESFCYFRVGRFASCVSDALGPAPLEFSEDGVGNIVAFGFSQAASPHAGVRFDLIGSESGVLGETRAVQALQDVEPKSFILLDDNTAIVAATIPVGTTRDLLIARTDTIPTGYYAPIPPSVELLVEGPPAWGYRVRSGSSPQATYMFSSLCGEARGRSSGNASGEWLVWNDPFSQVFAPQVEYSNTTLDTLWLESPYCNTGQITWQIGDFSGTVNGPMYQTPMPAAVEMLVQGPPTWAYRLRSGTFETSRFVFDNICTRASVALSGSMGDTWSIYRQNSRVTITAEAAIDARNSVDTLWLMSEECLGGTILWSSDSTYGEIEGPYIPDGPYFPQGFVQQFLLRLEQMGVSVRFAITGAPDMDALKVWRKTVGGVDSVIVGLVNAQAGQHVILDEEATRGRTYVYYLLATDDFGRIWKVPEASDTIFVDGAVFVPTEYSLSAAYPNPFNAVTEFDYALPNQTDVSFRVYDITGRQVATLVDEFQQPGTYSVVFDASLLSTGIYVYSFEAWNYTAHGKVLLLK